MAIWLSAGCAVLSLGSAIAVYVMLGAQRKLLARLQDLLDPDRPDGNGVAA